MILKLIRLKGFIELFQEYPYYVIHSFIIQAVRIQIFIKYFFILQ